MSGDYEIPGHRMTLRINNEGQAYACECGWRLNTQTDLNGLPERFRDMAGSLRAQEHLAGQVLKPALEVKG